MDEQIARQVLNQAFELWFAPELNRRADAGLIPKGFKVWGVQVVMDLDSDKPKVRINEEIRGVFEARAGKKIEDEKFLPLSKIETIIDVQLTDEDPNAGHLTAVLHKGHWYLFFDFRYNAMRITDQLQAAEQFLETAAFSIERKFHIAAVDNLYDAVQIMAKCFLLMQPDRKVLKAKTHGFIETNFNYEGKLRNISAESVKLLNKLSALRPKARYALKPVTVEHSELEQLLAGARVMRVELEMRRPQRYTANE